MKRPAGFDAVIFDAVIFDMDGTLTVPVIDWPEVRRAIGVPSDATIIDYIENLPGPEASRATTILEAAELEGTVGCRLNEGVHEILSAVRDRGLQTALVTNNHREAMKAVLDEHDLSFDVTFCRNDGRIKPAPDLILRALDALQVSPGRAIGIGDSRYDLAACASAGVRCVYLTHGNRKYDHSPFTSTLADFVDHL